jgi:hypothetical protein
MIWPHWHHEKCVITTYGILRQIYNIIRKWVEDKWNERFLKWVNNQAPTAKLAQEWRCAHMTSKGMSTRSEVNFYSYNWSLAHFLTMLRVHDTPLVYILHYTKTNSRKWKKKNILKATLTCTHTQRLKDQKNRTLMKINDL